MRTPPHYNPPGTLQEFCSSQFHYVEVIVQSSSDDAACCDVHLQSGAIRAVTDSVSQRCEAAALWMP